MILIEMTNFSLVLIAIVIVAGDGELDNAISAQFHPSEIFIYLFISIIV